MILADKFAALWGMIARRFQKQPNILGYNIINEPWAGNVYKVSG
jgi:endoglycosylceramidase